jgi:hypothetical protein
VIFMGRKSPVRHWREGHMTSKGFRRGHHVGTLHFKSPEAYRKWNATRFIHHIPHAAGYAHRKVVIAGHPHTVIHGGTHHHHHLHVA